MRNQQKGLTLIGFLFVLVIVVFFGYLIMRLFPVYSEYYGVVQAMKAVQQEPGSATWSPEQIRQSLDRKFNIGYVSSVKPNNIRLVRNSGGYFLNIAYEVRGPLIYNLEFVAKFNKSVDLVRKTNAD
jgi:hypothetical protein